MTELSFSGELSL